MLWMGLLACGGPDFEESTEDGLRKLSVTAESSNTGVARLPFEVEGGETSLLVTARLEDPMTTHILGLYDADDEPVWLAEDWLGGVETKTNAMFLGTTVSLNWPVLVDDAALTEGTWAVEVGVVDVDLLYSEGLVDVDVLLSQDADFSVGQVDVAVVYTAGLQDDPELTAAIDAAVSLWEDMYGDAGVEISVQTIVWDGTPPSSTPATDDDSTFSEIADLVGLRTIPVVIVENIDGIDALGLAGDIPGPLLVTNKSAVVVSHWQTAGVDLAYTELETRILAETLAHETGHFVGLYHPVETTWESWDALGDTERCGDARDCERVLGDNLMFPYPICFPPPCKVQSNLTDDQHGVMQRYTGVR